MRVYEVPRRKPSAAEAAAALARFDPKRQSRSNLLWGSAAAILGILLIVAAFYLIRGDSILRGVLGACSGVLGLVAAVCGVLWLTARTIELQWSRKEVEEDLARETDTIIEIQATRITSAPSVDDDANAIILHEGQGRAVYINSHQLFELDESGERYPSIWRIECTGRQGNITDLQVSGPMLEVQDAGGGFLEGAPDWYEVVVLDDQTPEQWSALLRA